MPSSIFQAPYFQRVWMGTRQETLKGGTGTEYLGGGNGVPQLLMAEKPGAKSSSLLMPPRGHGQGSSNRWEDADFRQGLGHPPQSPPGWTPSAYCYLQPHSTRAGEGVVEKSEALPRIPPRIRQPISGPPPHSQKWGTSPSCQHGDRVWTRALGWGGC